MHDNYFFNVNIIHNEIKFSKQKKKKTSVRGNISVSKAVTQIQIDWKVQGLNPAKLLKVEKHFSIFSLWELYFVCWELYLVWARMPYYHPPVQPQSVVAAAAAAAAVVAVVGPHQSRNWCCVFAMEQTLSLTTKYRSKRHDASLSRERSTRQSLTSGPEPRKTNKNQGKSQNKVTGNKAG